MEASKADLEWSARIDQALNEYPEMREYLDAIRGNIEATTAQLKYAKKKEVESQIDLDREITNSQRLGNERDSLAARLAAVRELHDYYTDQEGTKWCDHCTEHIGYEQFDSRPWPCPTIQTIDAT